MRGFQELSQRRLFQHAPIFNYLSRTCGLAPLESRLAVVDKSEFVGTQRTAEQYHITTALFLLSYFVSPLSFLLFFIN